MKLARSLSGAETKRVQTYILSGGALTTLTIWTKLEDPINLPKMFVLVLSAAVVLGLSLPIILSARTTTAGVQRISLYLVTFLVLGLLIATIATDVKFTALFGEYHRNNGFLSYLAMSILFIASALVFRADSAQRYFKFFAITGTLLTGYGFIQGAGLDPAGWVITYNPYITTLGNPNFTSGFLGLSGIAILYLLLAAKDRKLQLAYGVGLLADLYILDKSGSIQGLFGFGIGATAILLMKLWIFKRNYGQIGLLFVGLAGIPVALAVFNIGPLASNLYQVTLRNRFDYWSAALGMFKDHPIIGVGIDRFGEYYRQYAVQNQVVQGQVTDNAHSIYLQILATGGLVSFLPYIALVIFITMVGLRTLIICDERNKLLVSGVFGVWLGTIALNIVTVDNLGVGVWFWITAGVLIGVSHSSTKFEVVQDSSQIKISIKSSRNKAINANNQFPLTVMGAGLLALLTLVTLVPQLNASSNLKLINENASQLTGQEYNAQISILSKNQWSNPQYLLQLSVLSFRNSDLVTGDSLLDRVFALDKRSYYANYFRAFTLEAAGKRAEAITYREEMRALDPWNNASLIELIKDYISVGNKASAAEIAALIKQNYPGSQSDIDAAALLVG